MASTDRGRIPTPMVLAAASGMVCVGLVGWLIAVNSNAEPERPRGPNDVIIDGSSPEGAAEAFLDAWRKRAHDAALAMSVGEARNAVEERALADGRMSDEERAIKEQFWDTMAARRLSLQISESENLAEGRLALRGTAEGTFLERPYAREVEFVTVEIEGEWKVEQIAFGEILTEQPDVLDVDPELDLPEPDDGAP